MLICQHCEWQVQYEMLTGYCLRDLACERCNRITDLAIVQVPHIRQQQLVGRMSVWRELLEHLAETIRKSTSG
jgi:hypothetical protein